MKILAASDLHGDTRAVKKLAEKAEKEKVDAVVLAGDVTYFDLDTNGMIGPFLKKGKEVLFIPGNHDSPATFDFLVEKYRVHNIHGYYFSLGDIGFFGCGAAHNIGINQMPEDEIFQYLSRSFARVKDKKKKIMVTHVHPKGTKIEKFSTLEGSKAVRKAIEEFKPDVHLCGHIHEAEGMEDTIGKTKIFALGINGKVIEI